MSEGVSLKTWPSSTVNKNSYENETIMLTPQETVDMALAALAAVKSISQSTWTLKDQVDAATKLADIPVIPTTFIPA